MPVHWHSEIIHGDWLVARHRTVVGLQEVLLEEVANPCPCHCASHIVG
jgi:hypothetical protein